MIRWRSRVLRHRGRLIVDPPAFPLTLVGAADYYFPDCGTGDCSLWTAQGHVTLGLPLPVVRPYVLAGLQRRQDQTSSTSGAVIGGGVQLNFMLSLFLEAQLELADPVSGLTDATLDALANPLVVKGGIIF